jgi:hypothetical protein
MALPPTALVSDPADEFKNAAVVIESPGPFIGRHNAILVSNCQVLRS